MERLFLLFFFFALSNSYIYINNHLMSRINTKNYNPFSKKYFEEIQRKKNNTMNNVYNNIIKKYPITRPDFVEKMHRLNSKNSTVRDYEILGLNEGDDEDDDEDDDDDDFAVLSKFLTCV